MSRVVHFDIDVDDPERAIAFYRDTFGWEIKKWDGPMDYWLIMTGDPKEPGIDGGMALRSQSMGSTITIGVTSVDESIAKVVAAGGKILMPKNPIPGVGYFASCQDSEGNAFGIMETDMNAK